MKGNGGFHVKETGFSRDTQGTYRFGEVLMKQLSDGTERLFLKDDEWQNLESELAGLYNHVEAKNRVLAAQERRIKDLERQLFAQRDKMIELYSTIEKLKKGAKA